MQQVFEFSDYKAYLMSVLTTTGANRGIRSKLAVHLNCQISFLSQVLNGESHFSLEHGLKISTFLAHSKDENRFFMLLLEAGRASSKDLKNYYLDQIHELLERRKEIRNLIVTNDALSLESQLRYYSSWYYSAIHVIISITAFQTPQAIAERLKLPLQLVHTVLEFLESIGLAKFEQGRYQIGPKRIHLGRESDLISKHHSNWRLQALQHLERREDGDLFYSSTYSIAKRDIPRVRDILMRAIEQVDPLIMKSNEEELISLNLDLFKLT